MAFLELVVLRNFDPAAHHPTVTEADGYFVVKGNGVHARLCKRMEYPQTYCVRQPDGGTAFGYGPKSPRENDEYLRVEVSPTGAVTVCRDIFATLLLFYGVSDEAVCVSNDFALVAQNLPRKTPNIRMILETFMMRGERYDTIWNEIAFLGERHQLIVDNGAVRVAVPKDRPSISSFDNKDVDAKHFLSYFSEHLREVFFGKLVDAGPLAFECSGGLDSSTLPQFAGRHIPGYTGGYGASMLLAGSAGESQVGKLRRLYTAAHLVSVSTPLYCPGATLLKCLEPARPTPFYCYENYFSGANTALAAGLYERGVRVISTGYGGDDIFENVVSKKSLCYGLVEKCERARQQYPRFVTKRMIEAYIDTTPSKQPIPMPLLPASCVSPIGSTTNAYIEQGVWPVSPFLDLNLYRFCQGIPAHFRVRKEILRAFHAAYGFLECIYSPAKNESMGEVIPDMLAAGYFDSLVSYYVRHSQLANWGFVDGDILWDEFIACRASGSIAKRNQTLFCIYIWLCIESNLSQP